MPTYTFQEAFDKAYNGVIAQGGPSNTRPGGHCIYRGPDGKKCGVGHLLDDDKVWRESSTPTSPENLDAVADMFPGEPPYRAQNFLEEIQSAHDYAANATENYGVDFIDEFKLRMDAVALEFGLEIPK